MKLTILISTFLLTSIYAFSNEKIVSNPVAYAENSARAYSEGDFSDDSGFEGCKSFSQAKKFAVKCFGIRKILFHGGEEMQSRFECVYNFYKISNSKYRLLREECL